MRKYTLINRLACIIFLIGVTGVSAHVPEGTGATLQFYSYYTTNPPKINACLVDRTTADGSQGSPQPMGADNDEWKDAYIRHFQLKSSGGEIVETSLFFMNDDNYLYVGFSGQSNTLGNNMDIDLAFDQGIGGGDHNDNLEGGGSGINNGEYRARVSPDKGADNRLTEYSFNGTIWVQQNDNTEKFIGLGHNYGGAFVQAEFKIPINGNPSPDDNHSYLDVTKIQELGFNIFYNTQSMGEFHWSETNNDFNDAGSDSGWADLRLGVERSFVTLYSTHNANGNPAIDGNIRGGATPDDAWRGCYTRHLVLTNFAGKTINAVFYSLEDAKVDDNVYVGLKIYDDENDGGDLCNIYQEQNKSTTTDRNFLLDDGRENSLIADENAFTDADDQYWDGTDPTESWTQDAVGGTTHDAIGEWYSAGYYEYEFLIDRSTGTAQDIIMDDDALMGFLIRYHDADGAGSDYFWEHSPNADNIEIDPNNNVYVATGWPDLQLGAPYVQIIFPEDDSYVEGVVNVRIYAEDENVDGVISALFYRKSVPATTYTLTRIDGTDEWSGTWNVMSLPDGPDTLVFEVTDDDGITIERLVNVTIQNESGTVIRPWVRVTSPTPGDTLLGTHSITFTKNPGSGTKISNLAIFIDGDSTQLDTGATTHSITTNDYLDGAHTIQLQAINEAGISGISPVATYHFRNAPSVTLTSPTPDSTLSGIITVVFGATAVSPATIAKREIYVDGGLVDTATTAATYVWNTLSLNDGQHTLQVKVTDSKGKTAESALISVTTANSPSVNITSPTPDAVLTGTVTVQFNAAAVSPAILTKREIYVDGGLLDTSTTDSTYLWNTLNYNDGQHTVQIKVTDSNGKTGESAIVSVTLKNTPTVAITGPSDTSVINGIDTVTFTVDYPPGSSRDTTEISFNGGDWIPTTASLSHVWITTDYLDGSHTVQVRATGTNGKTGYSQIKHVRIRNTPLVTITAPSPGAVISGVDTVRYTIAPVLPAIIVNREISIDGGAWTDSLVDSTMYIISTVDWADGTHSVQVRATDDRGRIGYSLQLLFITRNEPSVTVLLPVAGDTLCDTILVTFKAVAVDPALIENTYISIDGGAYTLTETDSTARINSHLLADGSHIFKLRVVDNKDKKGESDERLFIVDNSPPLVADPKILYPDNASSAKLNSNILVTALVKDLIAGLKADSAVTLTSDFLDTSGTVTYILHDNGLNGDLVANDNIYTTSLTINTDTTGTIGYSITADDNLGNTITLTSVIQLDNTPPVVSPFEWIPDPEASTLPGDVTYFDKLILRGTYSDEGGSELDRVFISVKNDSGNHVNNSPIELAPKDSAYSRIITLVPGLNFIAREAQDKAGNKTARHDTITYIEPKATKVVGKNGGTVQSPNGVTVTIPQHALLKSKEITITKVDPIDEPEPVDPNVQLLAVPHEFGPDGLTFRKPITITLSYTDADLDIDQDGVNDFDPSKFTVVFWDGETWLNAGDAKVDLVNRLVSITVNHFTMFDIAEIEQSVSSELIAYWTHNPVKSNNGSNFVYKVPASGTVSLSIIDLAGDLVYQLIAKRTPVTAGNEVPFKWSGANVAERFAGAGLYVYVFTYTNAATGKSTVIRKPIGLLK